MRESRTLLAWSVFLITATFPSVLAAADDVAHPLDPLSKDEILGALEVLRAAGRVNTESRFSFVALHEPPKEEVLRYQPGDEFRRESFAVVYERAKNQTFEAVVDLKTRALLSWKHIPVVQPSFLLLHSSILHSLIPPTPPF